MSSSSYDMMRAALIVEGIDFSQYFVIVANKYMNQQTI
jgi:hypothetical protein